MGKATKWFRGLLGLKKLDSPPASSAGAKPPKRRWSFVRSRRAKDLGAAASDGDEGGVAGSGGEDPNEHAIAVAAAQAAEAVVKLTGGGRPRGAVPAHVSELAAVKIQAAFRAYLARRALRALKALVKLQALVRGHIIRKQTADMLRSIQALLRAQARARVGRSQKSESPLSSCKSSQLLCPDPATPEKFEQAIRVKSLKHDRSSPMLKVSSIVYSRSCFQDEYSHRISTSLPTMQRSGSKDKTPLPDKSNNIHAINPNRRNLFQSSRHAQSSDQCSHSFTTASKDSTARQIAPSPPSCEVQSATPLQLSREAEEGSPFCSASSSPRFLSASSKADSSRGGGPFTPTTGDLSRSYLSGYSYYPKYMACTESSRAKVRSHSAPKQRPQYERSSSAKRNSIQGLGDSKPSAQRVSALRASFANKAYPGSGRLDRLGMPLAQDHGHFAHRY